MIGYKKEKLGGTKIWKEEKVTNEKEIHY